MIRDYGEDVGSEETRSIESEDLRKDDVSDLFDESEEIHRPKEPRQPGNPGDLSADTGSVPNILFGFEFLFKITYRNYLFIITNIKLLKEIINLL
jgi:hypothetical protein